MKKATLWVMNLSVQFRGKWIIEMIFQITYLKTVNVTVQGE